MSNKINFTVKAREAVAEAERLANRLGNPEIRPGHLLTTLLTQEDSVVQRIANFVGVPSAAIVREATQLVDSYSKVSGGSAPRLSRVCSCSTPTANTPLSVPSGAPAQREMPRATDKSRH